MTHVLKPRDCPECGYSTHDNNGSPYHNECLRKVTKSTIRQMFLLGVAIGAIGTVLLNLLTGI